MKIAIYARVSKDGQDSRGREQDPENQLVPLRLWAAAFGDEQPVEYVDRVSGGTSDRPEFKRMLARIRQRRHDLVLVWSLDRFSREPLLNTLAYIQQLRRYGCTLRSHTESWLDTSGEGAGDLVLAALAWAAARERQHISERTKAGLSRSKKRLGRPRRYCAICGAELRTRGNPASCPNRCGSGSISEKRGGAENAPEFINDGAR